MGFFYFFKNKPKTTVQPATTNKKDLLQPVEVAPGVNLPKALAPHWNEIAKSKLNYISITATPAEQNNIKQSGFGFLPCLPKGYSYPTDKNENLMYPLAQINCSEIPVLAGYPNFGYLQFYIVAHKIYGLEEGAKVLYFTGDEVKNFETDFSLLSNIMQFEYNPLSAPHQLTFDVAEEYFGVGDTRLDQKMIVDLPSIIYQYPAVAEALQEEVWDNFTSTGNKMGGYAYFTQEDPRMYRADIIDFVLLLQIDSIGAIMWGDCGVANFFINPADLAKKDFSKVFYTWDC